MNNDPIGQEIRNLVELSGDQIMEHAEAALVLVTWKNEHGGYCYCYRTFGNPFASEGMAANFLDSGAQTRAVDDFEDEEGAAS